MGTGVVRLRALATTIALAATAVACAGTTPATPQGPVTTTIHVAERDWHTDICLGIEDAGPALMALTGRGNRGKDYDARFLCFGFGDRGYLLSADRGTWTTLLALLSALIPGDGAILLTVLRDTPAAAFGSDKAVRAGVDQAGLQRLRTFLLHAVRTDTTGAAMHLGDSTYPGEIFLAATATYNGLYTCNTWTADGLRAAGIPIDGPVLFPRGVMTQVRAYAASRPAK
ncbi:uncharacterized protein (TIGR02117 family) [Cupriavidus plantarum]|nr:uncharacterized protein (TIGR02117 family) [Cupriavidus plantarum]